MIRTLSERAIVTICCRAVVQRCSSKTITLPFGTTLYSLTRTTRPFHASRALTLKWNEHKNGNSPIKSTKRRKTNKVARKGPSPKKDSNNHETTLLTKREKQKQNPNYYLLKTTKRCPVCEKRFGERKAMLAHLFNPLGGCDPAAANLAKPTLLALMLESQWYSSPIKYRSQRPAHMTDKTLGWKLPGPQT